MKYTIWIILICCLLLPIPAIALCPSADLTGDCHVDLADIAVVASQWLIDGNPDPNGLMMINISDPGFKGLMSVYEITNAQYCEYLNTAMADGTIIFHNDYVYDTNDTDYRQPFFPSPIVWDPLRSPYLQIEYIDGAFRPRSRDGYSMSNHPVVMISWYGANAFCNYYGYRLPTESEWQAVADYDGNYIYGCGTTIIKSKANYLSANPLGLTSQPYTTPVGYYRAYGYGMCDMAGNVSEWTASINIYNNDLYRIIRGGSWGTGAGYCSVSNSEMFHDRDQYSRNIGFRVCR
jgi:formylglycine-generating enzyme required for sulfatase activity